MAVSLLLLPAEIRLRIFDHVYEARSGIDGFKNHGIPGGVFVDEEYKANGRLWPLLVCRQLYHDGSLIALSRTSFVVSNLFFNIPERLALLDREQIGALRTISFVADARHFRKLPDWRHWPFGNASLQLDTLTVILHRSSFWHYLFDFTSDIVQLLRQLRGVKRLVFIRNSARVKGSFKTWYNRLVGLIMKVDHHERYERSPPVLEATWWQWSYDELGQSFCLEAGPPRPLVDEATYMQQMIPSMEQLKVSVENEEWNPDPRARTMYY